MTPPVPTISCLSTITGDRFIWYEESAAAWLVTGGILVGTRVRRVDGVAGLNRAGTRTLDGLAPDWMLFPDGQMVRLRVRAIPPPPTPLHALVEKEACTPLVDALLARLPALAPAALLAALEAEGIEPYRRLVARTGLALGEAGVDALLQPAEGGVSTATRWAALLRQRAKQPLFDELIRAHPRLAAAAQEVLAQLQAAEGDEEEDDDEMEEQASHEDDGEEGEEEEEDGELEEEDDDEDEP